MLTLPGKEISYWRASAAKINYPKLKKDLEVDVAIVGGGISGLSAAYFLKQAGLAVAIIEKGTIGSGTTGHTTGKVTSQHGLVYNDLVQKHGKKAASLYGQANQESIDLLEKIIKSEKIDCGWQREDNYVFTDDPERVKQFRAEAKTAQALGLPASFETKLPLPFSVLAGVKFTNQAKMNAQAYITGLAKAVNGGGSYIFEQTRAIGYHGGQSPSVRVKGHTLRAKDVIVATNVPSLPLLARGTYCVLEYPHTSYIIAGRSDKVLKGMYISPDENHYSILPVTIGKDRLLLVGGENHIPGIKFSSKSRYQRLANYAEAKFGLSKIDYQWSARDYQAYDGIPLVGQLYPWSKHIYVVTAFKKWGLTNGTVSGLLLRDLITGQKNALAEIYNPHRVTPITSIPGAVIQSFK